MFSMTVRSLLSVRRPFLALSFVQLLSRACMASVQADLRALFASAEVHKDVVEFFVAKAVSAWLYSRIGSTNQKRLQSCWMALRRGKYQWR